MMNPIPDLIYCYVRRLDIRINSLRIQEASTRHPLPHSLRSTSDVLRQDATMNFIIKKKFICRIGGEHYYNAAIGGADRNMFFLDAGLSYKTKRMEYSLEARTCLTQGCSVQHLTATSPTMSIPTSCDPRR